MNFFHRIKEKSVHQGPVWHLVSAEFEAPDGRRFFRDAIRSPGAVGVVPLMFDAEGNPSVVLVRQYRPPLEAFVIEIPAGLRDIDGEESIDVARRELMEEAGLLAGAIEHLTSVFPSPGMTDSVTTLYLATNCTSVEHDRRGPEEDFMEIVHIPLDDAIAMVLDGRIADAKTVAGLLITERRLRYADNAASSLG